MSKPGDLHPAEPTLRAQWSGDTTWFVRLLGGFVLDDGHLPITRLPSRAATVLLARLALWPQRFHPREELVDLLWPGAPADVGRNRLRQTLSTLRSLIEPAGGPAVLHADRLGLRVLPGSLGCDVAVFEQFVREGQFALAAQVYRGELLPGFYDEWVHEERLRLQALALQMQTVPVGMAPSLSPAPAPASIFSPALDAPVSHASVPTYITRAFGVEVQLAPLHAQVQAHRLVTLLGPGGSGKTRLAAALAAEQNSLSANSALAPQSDRVMFARVTFDRVIFVALAHCATAAALLDSLHSALQLRPGTGDLAVRVAQQWAGQRVLLVLDNLEHLLPDAARVVSQLLAGSALMHLLVTSRRLLDVAGEREWRVAPLPMPARGEGLQVAAASPALALLVDRASAVRADFQLSARNLETLIELVHALQGSPLAIELAAKRLRTFAPIDMLAHLTQDMRGATPALALLKRRESAVVPNGSETRHASMERVVRWSWQQLSPACAQLLAAMTVFKAPCTAAAVQAVCLPGPGASASPLQGSDAHALLDELLSHSMLMAHGGNENDDDGSLRFLHYEPVREFARTQLAAFEEPALRQRHRHWWLRWAEGLGATPPLAQVRESLPDITAAMASALADDVADEALHLAVALRRAFKDVSPPMQALASLDIALQRSLDPELASRVHSLLGMLHFDLGQRDRALAHAEMGVVMAPLLDAQHATNATHATRASALHALASLRWRTRSELHSVSALLEEAMRLALASNGIETQASIFALRAFMTNVHERDFAKGEDLHRRALVLWEQAGNAASINGGMYNLAVCAQHQRRWGEAFMRLESVLAAAREQHDWLQVSSALNVQGNCLAGLREWPAAVASYREAADVAWRINEPRALLYALWNVPRALAHMGHAKLAAQLMAFAVKHWTAHFGQLGASDRHELRLLQRLVGRQLSPVQVQTAWRDGSELTLVAARLLLRNGTPDKP